MNNMDYKTLTGSNGVFDNALAIHPGEREILSILDNKLLKLPTALISKAIDFTCRSNELLLVSFGLHVTSYCMPEVYKTLLEVCRVFGIPEEKAPHLYITNLPNFNAYTMGADKAYITLSDTAVYRSTPAELHFLIGHELGHILAGHLKYKCLFDVLLGIGNNIPVIGDVIKFLKGGLSPLLYVWYRRSEYTADRFGLLACQNLDDVSNVFAKIAGLPLNYYPELFGQKNPPINGYEIMNRQAEEFRMLVNQNKIDLIRSHVNQLYSTHPRTMERVTELFDWVTDGWFEDIVEGTPLMRDRIAKAFHEDPEILNLMFIALNELYMWINKELKVPRKRSAPLVRNVFFNNGTFKNTELKSIVKIEFRITPTDNNEINYYLCFWHVVGNNVNVVEIKLPMETSWDFAPRAVSNKLIENGYQPVILEKYP